MKFYIESLGCASNLADTNRVKKYFLANSAELVENYFDADIIILMSCGFNKIIFDKNIARLKEFRKTNAKVYLGGCISKIDEKVNGLVDGFFSPKDMDKLDVIFGFCNKIGGFSPEFNEAGKKIIRISTGCEGKCSYCAIKIANGITKSRSIEEIKKDIISGLNEGYSSFVFTGEDTGSWGIDLGLNIIDLLDTINKFESKFKISLTTINPLWFIKIPKLLDIFKYEKVEKRVYLPLQSGSNRILRLMKRGYTVEQYLTIFEKLKKEILGIKIQSDVLVGFPTENEKDFKLTSQIVDKLDIGFLQVFVYTDMAGTYSNGIFPKVDFSVAVIRAKKVISDFLIKNRNIKNQTLVNTNLDNLGAAVN